MDLYRLHFEGMIAFSFMRMLLFMIFWTVEALFENRQEILDMMIDSGIFEALAEVCSNELDPDIIV